MNPQLADKQREVVDLLVTWGAPVDADLGDLFHALVEYRSHDTVVLLNRILEHAPSIPEPALGHELDALRREATNGGAGDPGFDDRVRAALERLGDSTAAALGDRRRRLSDEMEPWARLLDPERLDSLLGWLWRSEKANDPVDRLEALEALERARGELDSSRDGVEEDLRRAAERAGDDQARREATRALEEGDPRRIAKVRRGLDGLLAHQETARLTEEIDQASRRLVELCDRARRNGGGGATGAMVASAANAAEAALAAEVVTTDGLRALNGWSRTLEQMIKASGPEGGEEARRALGSELARDLRHALGKTGGAGAFDGRCDEIAGTLERADGRDEAGFFDAVTRGLDLLVEMRRASSERADAAAKGLAEAAQRLEGLLERLAADLPTERVVRARMELGRAEGAAASRDPEAMAEIEVALAREADEIEPLAARAQDLRRGRAEAERGRIRDEAARLAKVAPASVVRKVEEIGARASRASESELAELGRRLDDARRKAGAAVRLRASRLLLGASRKAGGAKGDTPPPLARLREALSGDDLAAIARSASEVEKAVPGASPRGPWLRIAAVVAAAVILLGGAFGWRWWSGRPTEYRIQVEGAGSPAEPVRVILVRDGRIHDTATWTPGEGARFRLPDGRYEVYVNERYTGTVIHVPGDRPTAEGVAVPWPYPGAAEHEGPSR